MVVQCRAWDAVPCFPADALHLGCSPFLSGAKSENCRFSDFIEGLGSEISSKFAVDQNTEVSFKSTQANLALLFVRYENGGEYHFGVFDDYYTIAALFALSAFSFDRKPITHGKAALYVVA